MFLNIIFRKEIVSIVKLQFAGFFFYVVSFLGVKFDVFFKMFRPQWFAVCHIWTKNNTITLIELLFYHYSLLLSFIFHRIFFLFLVLYFNLVLMTQNLLCLSWGKHSGNHLRNWWRLQEKVVNSIICIGSRFFIKEENLYCGVDFLGGKRTHSCILMYYFLVVI